LWLTNAVPGWLRDFVAIRNAFSRNAVKNGLVLIVSGLLLYDVSRNSTGNFLGRNELQIQ